MKFEHYEMEGVTFKDEVRDADGFKMVWFKHPDGNILHLTVQNRQYSHQTVAETGPMTCSTV